MRETPASASSIAAAAGFVAFAAFVAGSACGGTGARPAAGAAGDDAEAAEPIVPEVVAPEPRALEVELQRLVFESAVATLEGEPSALAAHRGQALLVVNVASQCGLTPQYEGLQRLQQRYGDRGFTVVGFPCNQFGGQEPGTAEEIRTFCDSNYGITFPIFEKVEVNGEGRHPVYQGLTAVPDIDGEAGDVQWNFEKFVISADGARVTRFRPKTDPEDPRLLAAIEAALPEQATTDP